MDQENTINSRAWQAAVKRYFDHLNGGGRCRSGPSHAVRTVIYAGAATALGFAILLGLASVDGRATTPDKPQVVAEARDPKKVAFERMNILGPNLESNPNDLDGWIEMGRLARVVGDVELASSADRMVNSLR